MHFVIAAWLLREQPSTLLWKEAFFPTALLASRPRIREIFACGIRNQGKFYFWNPESWVLESGIRNVLTIRIQNPSSSDKDWNPVPRIRNPRRGFASPQLSWISLHGGSSFVNTISHDIYLFENMQCHYIFSGRYRKSVTNTSYDKAKNTLPNSLGKNEVQTNWNLKKKKWCFISSEFRGVKGVVV